MTKKLVAFLLVLSLCFAYMIPVGMAEGEPIPEEKVEVTESPEPTPEADPEPTPETSAPGAPAAEPTPEADPEPGASPEGEPSPEAPAPELTPEELFLAAVSLLPQDPEAIETVTEELEEQLKEVTEQLYALFTEEQLAALAEEAQGEAQEAVPLPNPLRAAALLVLRLNARVTELNAQAAQAVRDLIAALPAPEEITPEHEPPIAQAMAAYDALTATQKALVPEEEAALLADLLARAKAAAVDGLIALLPEPGAVTLSNYTQYQPPAEEASKALTALTDYQRGFVKSADALEEFIGALDAAGDVDALVNLLTPFSTGAEAARGYLTYAPGPTSIDAVFAADAAYWALDEGTHIEYQSTLDPLYALFQPTLAVAQELWDIRETGRIVIEHPSLVVTVGGYGRIPAYHWEGIPDALKDSYELTVEFPDSQDFIRRGEEDWLIMGVQVTQEDARILVYGSGATALRELAVPITVTVVPVKSKTDIDAKAFMDEDIVFNRAYTNHSEGLADNEADTLFSIGKYYSGNLREYDGATVAFTNKKLPPCFSAVLEGGYTGIFLDNSKDGHDKNATYKTRLEYTIPVTGVGDVTVLTNEFKIIVTDKPTKLAFKTPVVVNRFYESAAHYEGTDSFYPPVWLTPIKDPDYSYPSLENLDSDKYPVSMELDRDRWEYKLVVHDYKAAKDVSWKVRFRVYSEYLRTDREYVITIPISIKRVAPALSLKPKTVTTDDLSKGFTVSLCSKKGVPLDGLGINATGIGFPDLPAAYPYHQYYEVEDVVNLGESEWRIEVAPDGVFPTPVQTPFKLLLRVPFHGTGNGVDLPLTVSLTKPKISLAASSCVLNAPWGPPPGGGKPLENRATVGFKTNVSKPPRLTGYSVGGFDKDDVNCPLVVEQWDEWKCIYVTGKSGTVYGPAYKVLLTFDNGQTLKLTVNTKAAQNKLKMGKTAFVTDLKSEDDVLSTPLTAAYTCNFWDDAVFLEYKNGKNWESLPAGMPLEPTWTDCQRLEIKGVSKLPLGKHTFRVYASAQQIPAAKGAVFTITVKQAAVKFTATPGSLSADVLKQTGDVLFFNKLKLTGLADPNALENLNTPPLGLSPWRVLVGGDGAKYLEVASADSEGIALRWKGLGTYAMRQNGLKPFKLTLQICDRDMPWKIIAETKTFTVKPVQKPKVKVFYSTGSAPWVRLYSNTAYYRRWVLLDLRNVLADGSFTKERVAWVAVKGAEKSNYGAYFTEHRIWYDNENCAYVEIGYKNAAAALKAKASETLTLLVMMENGVTPFEVKVTVKNVR